jgi:CHAT domain-containing protein/tetratricopeptide (TPR) repeat protein
VTARRTPFASIGGALLLSVGAALLSSSGSVPRSDTVAAIVEMEESARVRWHEAERLHGADSPEAGAALSDLARLLQRRHGENLAEGTDLARRALAITESHYGAEHAEVASALEGLAMWLWYSGDYLGERLVVERALSLREHAAPPDDAGIARDLHFLSDIYRVEGDYGRALQYRERAGNLVERLFGPDGEPMAVHLHYLAVIQASIGDQSAAIANAQRAVDIREKAPSPMDSTLARSLNLLGGLLVDTGELGRAEPALDRARALWEAAGSADQTDAALALTNLGRLFAARHDDARAAGVFERVAAIRSAAFGADHPLVAQADAQLGAAQRRLGNRAAARSSLRRALDIQQKRSVPSFPEWAQALREQALLDASDGRVDVALREALDVERLTREHFRVSALGLSEREALTQARSRVGGLDLAWTWASELASRGALDDGSAMAIVDAAIQSRALVLDTLATRQRVLALHQDDETAERVETLRRAQRRLAHLLMEGAAPQSPSALSGLLREAQAEADRAERALAEKSREYRQERGRLDPGLADVRNALPPGSALVSYFRYSASDEDSPTGVGAAYAASVLTPDSATPRIVPLGTAAEIDGAVQAWSASVSRDPRPRGEAGEAEYLGLARRLSERIWEPIGALPVGLERVFIVPDGTLLGVNLATLVTKRGEYFIESGLSFQYLTAERDLVGNDDITTHGNGLLALGDPAYGVPHGPGTRRFDPLPGSRQEAREVASLWSVRERTRLLTGDDAGETLFKRLAPSFRVLHVATHAFFESGIHPGENPLRVAGLAMSGANRDPRPDDASDADDGILTAEEIALLDLRGVDWAVLSACATGQGVLEPGEGILGLRRAFQIAGAHTLVVSLWPVEDDATRYWMRALYTSRKAGASTVDAVRAASRDVLADQRRTGGTTHPYFWGGFVSIGDWR